MPSLLNSATQWQHNLIVRPKQATAALVQLDDLRGSVLERVRSTAFLVLTTSTGNHQAWVAVREGGPDCAVNGRRLSGPNQPPHTNEPRDGSGSEERLSG